MMDLRTTLENLIKRAEKSLRDQDASASIRAARPSVIISDFVLKQQPSLPKSQSEWRARERWKITSLHNPNEYIMVIREPRFYVIKPDQQDHRAITLGWGINEIEHNSMSREDILLLRLL